MLPHGDLWFPRVAKSLITVKTLAQFQKKKTAHRTRGQELTEVISRRKIRFVMYRTNHKKNTPSKDEVFLVDHIEARQRRASGPRCKQNQLTDHHGSLDPWSQQHAVMRSKSPVYHGNLLLRPAMKDDDVRK